MAFPSSRIDDEDIDDGIVRKWVAVHTEFDDKDNQCGQRCSRTSASSEYGEEQLGDEEIEEKRDN